MLKFEEPEEDAAEDEADRGVIEIGEDGVGAIGGE